LRQKIGSCIWDPGPGNLGQKCLTYLTDVTHKNLKSKTFLIPTRRLAASFEGLNSSLVQSPGELWHENTGMSTGWCRHEFKVQVYCTPAPNVNKKTLIYIQIQWLWELPIPNQ